VQPLQFLERHFGSYVSSKNEALFTCPFCKHHKPKLSVNTESWFWKCWVCDTKGRSLLSLIWRLEDRAAFAQYKACFPHHVQGAAPEIPEEFVLELPAEYIPICTDKSSFHHKRAMNYVKRRNISIIDLLRHKIGYCIEGRYRDRIILPSFDSEGRLNFFTGRTFVNNPWKYLNPDTPTDYKRTIIFNELNIDWEKPIFLVEGFLDMLKVGSNVIPLFGSTLPEESKLFLNLVMHNCEVYVCLDADARDKQVRILDSLNAYRLKCYDLQVYPHKDVGDMPASEFKTHLLQARRASKSSMLREKIRNL
jgi:DNA primase